MLGKAHSLAKYSIDTFKIHVMHIYSRTYAHTHTGVCYGAASKCSARSAPQTIDGSVKYVCVHAFVCVCFCVCVCVYVCACMRVCAADVGVGAGADRKSVV